jgi:hypothetical protein
MINKRKLLFSLTFALATASADPLLYVVPFNPQPGLSTPGQFGLIDPVTGAYQQIGPSFADPLGGLVPGGPTGFFGVSFSGNLDSINPSTGAITVIGATGLGSNALETAGLNGILYETDFSNNLYTVNPTTGLATLIGSTGIGAGPSDPADLFDEAFFSANGNLYATWDVFNATTLALVVDPELYQINPITGLATEIGPTARQIDAAFKVNGTVYAFTATNTPQVLSLNLATGNTTVVTNYDQAAYFIEGATATPEPGSFALLAIGIAVIVVSSKLLRAPSISRQQGARHDPFARGFLSRDLSPRPLRQAA